CASASAGGSTSMPYCGLVRERGIVRTSATTAISALRSRSMNASIGCLAWPIVWNGFVIAGSAAQPSQCAALVHGDMIGLVALDLVLRVVAARMVDVALVRHILLVDAHD